MYRKLLPKAIRVVDMFFGGRDIDRRLILRWRHVAFIVGYFFIVYLSSPGVW